MPAPATPEPERVTPPPLDLTPEPSPLPGDARLSRAQLDRWSALYGPEHRQLRRWIARGREKNDPCPLDDPARMPAWIDAHIGKIRRDMRDRVQAAADAALAAVACSPPAPPVVAPLAEPVPSAASPGLKPLDLASVGGVEGETVELFRRLFAAAKMQLEDAYQGANEDRIAKLHTRLERVGESLRKHEIAAEAKARRRGELLEKSEVLNEVALALGILKNMHEQMAKFILSELPELDPDTTARVRTAIDRARERELVPLRNLAAFRTPQDVLFALAA